MSLNKPARTGASEKPQPQEQVGGKQVGNRSVVNEKTPEGVSSSEKLPYLNNIIDKLLGKYDIRHPKPSISRAVAKKMLARDIYRMVTDLELKDPEATDE